MFCRSKDVTWHCCAPLFSAVRHAGFLFPGTYDSAEGKPCRPHHLLASWTHWRERFNHQGRDLRDDWPTKDAWAMSRNLARCVTQLFINACHTLSKAADYMKPFRFTDGLLLKKTFVDLQCQSRPIKRHFIIKSIMKLSNGLFLLSFLQCSAKEPLFQNKSSVCSVISVNLLLISYLPWR